MGYNALRLTVPFGRTSLTVCNLHGVSLPGHKLDTPARLAQSDRLLDFMRGRPGEAAILGDFNLFPDTESILKIERAGYRDLIKEYRVTTTRGTLVKRLHPEYATLEYGFQEYADFAFVTPDVRVAAFEVPDLPVSDHLPLILTLGE
jgi:endonuclease/exonuclease/phosphatase family metal-dependent hydrolase